MLVFEIIIEFCLGIDTNMPENEYSFTSKYIISKHGVISCFHYC